MLSGINASITGMLRAIRKTEATATNIANVQTPGFDPIVTDNEGFTTSGDTVSSETSVSDSTNLTLNNSQLPVPSNVNLTTEATNTVINRRAFEANLAALKAQTDNLGEFIDRFK